MLLFSDKHSESEIEERDAARQVKACAVTLRGTMLRCGRWCELLRQRIGKRLSSRRREIVENLRSGNHRLNLLNEFGIVDGRQGDL